jgi:hypothetical protein
MAYLRAKREGQPDVVLGRTQQAAKNLSLSRAIAGARQPDRLREVAGRVARSDAVCRRRARHHAAEDRHLRIDPCAPKSETDWQSNMRVEFRILQVEAEASAFKPL